MNLHESMVAARASLFAVTDRNELAELQEPLRAYKANAPYLDFLPYDIQGAPFRSDVAYAIANTEGKAARSVRRVQRSAGRDTFAPPLLNVVVDYGLFDMNALERLDTLQTDRMPHAIGQRFALTIESYALLALLHSAEAQGKVTTASTLRGVEVALKDATDRFGPKYSVIYNPKNFELVQNFPRPLTWGDGMMDHPNNRYSNVIGEGVLLAVKNAPDEVGFVMSQQETKLFTRADDLASLRMSAQGQHAIGVWGDAPVVKIDARSLVSR